MAVSITQSPQFINAAYTRLPYVVSGSVTTGNPQYQYVMDVYRSGSSDLITRVTQTANPEGVAVFDPARILQGELSYDGTWKIITNSGSLDRCGDFELKFGEQYGTSISSSVTVYPNITSSIIRVSAASVDPYATPYTCVTESIQEPQNSFNFAQRYPRPFDTYPLIDRQLSDDPYHFLFSPDSPYHSNDCSFSTTYKLIGPEDYETIDYILAATGSGIPLTSCTPRDIIIQVYDENKNYLFYGLSYQYPGSFDHISYNGYYSGSIDGLIWSYGTGPMNLRDVRVANYYTSSYGDKSFGEVIDSGSWVYYSISNRMFYSGSAHTFDYDNYWNENKVDLLVPMFGTSSNINTDIPYPNNVGCTEKTRFAFINKYGAWDYYTNWNPVRRASDIQRESVTLPLLDYSGTDASFNVNRRGQLDYYIGVKDRFVVDTPPLDQPVANWLEQLIESPSVYIQRGTDFVPVIITNAQYREDNSTARNKLFTYTIEFEPANQPYGEWTAE